MLKRSTLFAIGAKKYVLEPTGGGGVLIIIMKKIKNLTSSHTGHAIAIGNAYN